MPLSSSGGFFACLFLALLHLLDECLGLLLVGKGKGGRALLELERMKERTILVICKVFVNFLVPDHASANRLHPKLHG